MSNPMMIQCRQLALSFQDGIAARNNVIEINNTSVLQGNKPTAEQTLSPPKFAANQTWEVLPDPAGSRHSIIQNPATGYCIEIQNNSTSRGALLDASAEKKSDNKSQLWDFLPDPFGSEYFFIQNPQTGYVIEMDKGSSSKSGASLVVNPRRLFDNNFQLWAGVDPAWTPATFPALTLAQPAAVLQDTANYVLLPTDQTKNLTGITVTLDIIKDLVADSFSVQINGNPPYPGPKGVTWDTQWMQFGLFMQNNTLVLWNQLWPTLGTGHLTQGDPLPSVQESSGVMLQLEKNTVPAGTRIVLTLTTDPKNDYVTGVSGKVYDKSGSSIGTPVDWPAIGQPTWIGTGSQAKPDGPPVQESDLAPLGAFQVVVVGNPNTGGYAHFTAGMGTITVTCTPNISAQLYWPSPSGAGTAETSNCYYGKVQEGYHHHIAQPFGLPSPKITSVTGNYNFAGTGLLPNSKLKAKATLVVEGTGKTVDGAVSLATPDSHNDGSFSLGVTVPATIVSEGGKLTTTVTDADGNWASGSITTDVGVPQILTGVTSTDGLHH
jgi:Ricin-type beta-trefoil lectin domain-like